ncbi:MAG: response regulator [Planctomycetota bacterium]
MKLNEITVGMTIQAIDLYIRVAFSGLPPKIPPPTFRPDFSKSIEEQLDIFESESADDDKTHLHRYVLRLGNQKYPFMKFVLQEDLIMNEYIFLVDTHDDMFNMPSSEFDELRKIREFNREIKIQIEDLWTEFDIPTLASLKTLVADSGSAKEKDRYKKYSNKAILVVDDDQVMGETLEELLKSRGFNVDRLFDGVDAVREADPLRHVLIIMDNDMKIMDGQEACRILKEDPHKSSIPIMIASARSIDIAMINRADAYLVKPFHQDVLFSFIRHILKIS